MEGLFEIFASSGFGAVVGGVFGWLNRKEDAKAARIDKQFQVLMMREHSKAESAKYDSIAFAESQKTISKFGDAVKSAVRPFITGALLWMVYRILTQLELLTGGLEALDSVELFELYRQILLNIISLASVSVSWWFASRPSGHKR